MDRINEKTSVKELKEILQELDVPLQVVEILKGKCLLNF